MASIKIGDTYRYEYKRTEKQYRVGQYVKVENLQFVVEETDELAATGKVINTYGHKRRNGKH